MREKATKKLSGKNLADCEYRQPQVGVPIERLRWTEIMDEQKLKKCVLVLQQLRSDLLYVPEKDRTIRAGNGLSWQICSIVSELQSATDKGTLSDFSRALIDTHVSAYAWTGKCLVEIEQAYPDFMAQLLSSMSPQEDPVPFGFRKR